MLIHHCTLTSESNAGECSIVTQVVKCAPRVCGDDPGEGGRHRQEEECSPRMRG